jgi:protein-disulfide isomerase
MASRSRLRRTAGTVREYSQKKNVLGAKSTCKVWALPKVGKCGVRIMLLLSLRKGSIMSKRFLIILIVAVLAFAGLLFFNKKDDTASSNGNDETAQLSEHTYGSGEVVLVEYGDFQCPACGQFYPIVQQLKQEYEGRVTFQFRHFPLTEIHQNALISSRAAEAAAMQGKFFEMHDHLYENQQAWSTSTNPTPIFEGYAEQLSLDMDKFSEDMRSEQTNDIIQADRNYARDQGFSSTPTFVLDGEKIENPRTYDDFKKLLDDAIAAKQGDSGQEQSEDNQ